MQTSAAYANTRLTKLSVFMCWTTKGRGGRGIEPQKALRILLPQRKKLTKNERSRGRVIPGP